MTQTEVERRERGQTNKVGLRGSNRMSWSIVSNAALRSNKTSTEMSPLSDAFRRSFVIFTSAVMFFFTGQHDDFV